MDKNTDNNAVYSHGLQQHFYRNKSFKCIRHESIDTRHRRELFQLQNLTPNIYYNLGLKTSAPHYLFKEGGGCRKPGDRCRVRL